MRVAHGLVVKGYARPAFGGTSRRRSIMKNHQLSWWVPFFCVNTQRSKKLPPRNRTGECLQIEYSVVMSGRVPDCRPPFAALRAARSCFRAFRCHRLHLPVRLPISVPRRRYRSHAVASRSSEHVLRLPRVDWRGEGFSRLHFIYVGLIAHAASVRCRGMIRSRFKAPPLGWNCTLV